MGFVLGLAFCFSYILLHLCLLPTSAAAAKNTYIVHMKHHHKPPSFATHAAWYADHLHSLTSAGTNSILYTYNSAYNGFAAVLSDDEVKSLRNSDSVLGVYKDTVYTLDTTRSPHFLGLDKEPSSSIGYTLKEISLASQDVIVGVLDSGVWPESKSFADSGLPDVPARWRGKCEAAHDFDPKVHCNKKLIGARVFFRGQEAAALELETSLPSPRDPAGHGTHTASTAVGSPVANASFFGYAHGTARGMAPNARLATYKVCGEQGCLGSDMLAGIDQAIIDGVDVLSVSLSNPEPSPDYVDVVAIGAFAAMERGIFVSCSAGNNGPRKGTVANAAPWLMTVGASTIDRDFLATVSLGNGQKYTGASMYSGVGMGKIPVGLVYKRRSRASTQCLPGSLSPADVRGKIVVCNMGGSSKAEKGVVVRNAGGVGMIVANTVEDGEEMEADSYLLPALSVGKKDGDRIRSYVMSVTNPTALLAFQGTVVNVKPSPVVSGFSSRGPNQLTPEILKPDVIGPGLNILAAWPDVLSPSATGKDTRKSGFTILSGTSMSCPHVTGLAALLKAVHPQWSPGAIKSALMTTAFTVDNTNSTIHDGSDHSVSTPWAYGAGHVDLHRALSPGLVYNVTSDDYIAFLCSLDYPIDTIQSIVRRSDETCARRLNNPGELNYPSFSVVFGGSRVRYTRRLTNVGGPESVYKVSVVAPAQVQVMVEPTTLVFTDVGDVKDYAVTFVSGRGFTWFDEVNAFGWITWKDAHHQVRSPVAFTWPGIE